MIQIGKQLMYRDQVCTLVDIAKQYRNDTDYYVLQYRGDQPLTIRVPVDLATKTMRPLITKKELKALVARIPHISAVELGKYTKGEEYKRLLASGDHEDVIKVIKTAYLRKQERLEKSHKPTESDKLYFRQAEKRLYAEVACVLDMSIQEAKEFIVQKVNDAEQSLVKDEEQPLATA